ncbi:MAG: DUF58 domain-containing protein [Candidatus Latescibacterota bacterium]|nr:DUF58 domain-containing protein [Candidatus Latescibacterota bacterium]
MIPHEILDKVHLIEIQAGRLVDDIFAGEYHSVFKGHGMEFAEVREYQPGDDVRTIDWNVTARSGGKPFVKVYDEERELTVVLVVDASASEAFGSGDRLKGEVAVEISALLAFSAIRNHDRVGLLIFTDEVEVFVPPKKGKRHVLRVIRELLYFRPRGRRTSIAGALEYLDRIVRRHSVVFLISDFIDSGYETPLQRIGRRHDLIAITMEDPREREIPDVGMITMHDAETGAQVLLDTGSAAVRESYTEGWRENRQALSQLFLRHGVDEICIDTSQPYVEPLARFFQGRMSRAS